MKKKVGITEVVLRDGNQSLLSTRLKIEDILPIAKNLDELIKLKSKLVKVRKISPLFNTEIFTKDLENKFIELVK